MKKTRFIIAAAMRATNAIGDRSFKERHGEIACVRENAEISVDVNPNAICGKVTCARANGRTFPSDVTHLEQQS